MKSRERVRRAIRFEGPDRAPISHAVLPAALIKYDEALGDILREFREDFGWDYMDDLPREQYPPLYRPGRNADDFGTVWQVESEGVCGIPVEWPVTDLESYGAYRWPAVFDAGPPTGRLYSGHMAGYDPRWYARGAWITYFEQLQQLRGMENLLIDIASESPDFYRMLDDLMCFNLEWIDRWTGLEYDGLHFADDWGGQFRLMIRPATWRRIFKPRYAEMFRRVHEAGMDVWYHSDGMIGDILSDLIELGVDVVNCQTSVIGLDWIAANARGKITFRTDIDRQRVLASATPAKVKDEVQRVFEACGTRDGGLIACGEISPEVPIENIRAMYEAFAHYGAYR